MAPRNSWHAMRSATLKCQSSKIQTQGLWVPGRQLASFLPPRWGQRWNVKPGNLRMAVAIDWELSIVQALKPHPHPLRRCPWHPVTWKVPRPIAQMSTRNPRGRRNLGPHLVIRKWRIWVLNVLVAKCEFYSINCAERRKIEGMTFPFIWKGRVRRMITLAGIKPC